MDAGALRQMPHGLIVRSYAGYDGTYAFDTASRDTGFVAEVQIICDYPVVIDALEVELPWCTVDEWETKPCNGRFDYPVCAFPGERNRTFPAARVLNDRILGRISKGTSLNGVLVGVGRGPIPAQEHGDSVKADLVFHTIGEDRLVARLEVELRRVRQERAVHKPATRRVPLFPPEDPGKTTSQGWPWRAGRAAIATVEQAQNCVFQGEQS
jgi:hypothetical protein